MPVDQGKLPYGKFGENAAWWGIMILSLNLNAMMKGMVYGKALILNIIPFFIPKYFTS